MRSLQRLLLVIPWQLLLWVPVDCLDNGVALTPPMGWIHWERFECNTQCDTDPDNCISEKLFMDMADHFVSDGFRDAGYTIISTDDCWLARDRDSQGRLAPDPNRFPSGMKALADYMHSRGLKLGVYEDVGTKTCAGFPGSEGHFQTDAQTFAEWGVDFLKFDACNSDIPKYHTNFPLMGEYLNKTGRHIVYSCEWPMYEKAQGGTVVIGNFGLSHDQERVQMALYAILASPMFMSNDLRKMRNSSRQILLNKNVIAVNQDPLGIQGKRIMNLNSGISVWTRPVVPKGSYAVAFLYSKQGGYPLKVTYKLYDLGLNDTRGYHMMELFDGIDLGKFTTNQTFSCFVNPTGVYIMKATVVQNNLKAPVLRVMP